MDIQAHEENERQPADVAPAKRGLYLGGARAGDFLDGRRDAALQPPAPDTHAAADHARKD